MAESFQQLLHWVQANPGWAGAVVFLMAFAESMAIVGMVVPGVAILFAVGALIGAGALDFWQMVAWAVAGAILGDGLSFWLGRHYRQQLTRLWPFNRHPEMLQRGIAFFQKYGGKSVALGRFFGPVRAVIPLVAGMMEMPPGRFLFANVLSALGWAPAYLLPGMAFGASLELASEVALRLVLLLVVLLASLWFLGWLSHRLFLWLQPRGRELVRQVLLLGERHPRLRQLAGALGDPDHPEARGLAMFAGLLLLSGTLLALLALIPEHPLLLAGGALRLGLDQLRNDAGNHIMLAISAIAGQGTGLAMLFALWLLLTGFGLRQAARHWLAGTLFAWLIAAVLEYFLRRHPALLPVLPDLFVLRATVFYGLAAVLVATPVPHPRRWLIYSTATILVMAVLLAQLYFGSTLLATLSALAGGLAWVTGLGMAYRTHGQEEALRGRHALSLAGVTLLLALATAFSTPAPPHQGQEIPFRGTLPTGNWQQEAAARLPAQRSDVFDSQRFGFNVQYAGDLSLLEKALIVKGWQRASSSGGLEWLRLLAPSTPLSGLPVLPHSHEGRSARVIFVKVLDPQQRLALYFWPSGFFLEDGRPLWLGEAVLQERRQWLSLFTYPVSRSTGREVLKQLEQDLVDSGLELHHARQGALLQIAAPGSG